MPPAETSPADLLTRENTPQVWATLTRMVVRSHDLASVSLWGSAAQVLAAANAARGAIADVNALFSGYARYELRAAVNAANNLESVGCQCALAADRLRLRAAGHGDENPTASDGWAEHAEGMLAAVHGVTDAAQEMLGERLALRDRRRLVRSPDEVAALNAAAEKRQAAAEARATRRRAEKPEGGAGDRALIEDLEE